MNWRIRMSEMEKHDTDMVMTVLEALQAEMTADLDELQNEIRSAGEAAGTGPDDGPGNLGDLMAARTALHSGLASIREVLGWIDWITERDAEQEAEGSNAVVTLPLPSALGFPIH
jgi:hypothetical protein